MRNAFILVQLIYSWMFQPNGSRHPKECSFVQRDLVQVSKLHFLVERRRRLSVRHQEAKGAQVESPRLNLAAPNWYGKRRQRNSHLHASSRPWNQDLNQCPGLERPIASNTRSFHNFGRHKCPAICDDEGYLRWEIKTWTRCYGKSWKNCILKTLLFFLNPSRAWKMFQPKFSCSGPWDDNLTLKPFTRLSPRQISTL